MDSLANYQNLINTVAQANNSVTDQAKSKEDEVRAKIQEFTDPFEQIAADNLTDFLTNNVLKVANKYNVPIETAKKYIQAYKANGARGLVDMAKGDFKSALATKTKEAGEPVPTDEVRLGDMPKEDFAKIKGITKDAIDNQVQSLNPVEKQQFSQSLLRRVQGPDDIPDDLERFQANQQHALDALDEVKGNQLTSQLTRAGADAEDEFGQGLKSTTTVFKNTVDQAGDLANKAEAVAKTTAENAGKTAEKVGGKLAEDVGKGALEGGEADPEGGEVVGALIGVGTFLGGLLSARHRAHHIASGPIMNYAIQQGA